MKLLTLSLGTNMGDRESNIRQALSFLETALGDSPVARTGIINTESVGFIAPDFLNMLVQYRCDIPPMDVLNICKDIERKMGRTESVEIDEFGKRVYHDRIIDIDILKYGDFIIDTEKLTIPHPQIYTREYIKELAELLPNW